MERRRCFRTVIWKELFGDLSGEEPGCGGDAEVLPRFSFPGQLGSHCTPEVPGSIHEGGELGYSLSHAFGAAFDNPDLIVSVVVGDGEAETGPLATSWHSNKFLNPIRDGAVLPILHLNGYKIANPTILARIPPEELESSSGGMGGRRISWRATTRRRCISRWRRRWKCVQEIRAIQKDARAAAARPRAAALADDHSAFAERVDGPEGS